MPQQILIAGAGYVGLYAAKRIAQRGTPGEIDVTVVNPENFMVYRPLLPEVASGTLEPRHAVIPLRDALRHVTVLKGSVTELHVDKQRAGVTTAAGDVRLLDYDHLVLGFGSVSRTMPIPGLAEHGIGFTTIAEASHLRDHVLHQLEIGAATADEATRRAALTFVVVGGGYTGVEALAELQDMSVSVAEGYPGIRRDEVHWVLVEATGRLLPTVPGSLADRALAELRHRGIDVRLHTTLEEANDGSVRLSGGANLPTNTLVWVAGVAPAPAVSELGLPHDDKGRLQLDSYLRVAGQDKVWGAGDCAAVHNAATGEDSPPTAQQAVRQGRSLADNILATIRDEHPQRFSYSSRGEFVTLGRHKGVAEVYGLPLDGLAAWLTRRAYYASQIPTANRKLRALLDWATSLPFGHDVVDLGSREQPRRAFREATRR